MAKEVVKKSSGGSTGEVVLDFSGVKPFDPLEERDAQGSLIYYLCEVHNFALGKAKSTGDDKVSLELNVLEPEKFAKRRLFREYSLKPQAMPFLHEFIKAADPSAKLDDQFRFNPANYIGLKVSVTVENEAFEEQIRSRVKKIYSASKSK
jgi:hypothetical protein